MATISPLGMMNSLTTMNSKTGLGGLVSGMDLDELVVGLTNSQRTKIAKEQQTVQKLEWKQEAYRSVTKALEEFQKSYLDVLSPTNFRRSTFFTTKKVDVSSSAVSVIPSASAMAGSISIDSISRLADSQRISSGSQISAPLGGELKISEGMALEEFAASLEGKAISLSLDGRVRTVSFGEEFSASIEGAENPILALEVAFQAAIDDAFGVIDGEHRVIKAEVVDGKLTISASGSELVVKAVGGDKAALTKLGLVDGQSNRLSLYQTMDKLALNEALVPNPADNLFEFTINGVGFSFEKGSSIMDVMNKINSSNADVIMSYSTLSDTFTLTSKETGAGEHIKLEETKGNLLTGLGLTQESGANIQYGKNAVLRVNGIDIERSTNVFSVDGVNIELKETSESAVKIHIRDDSSGVKEPMEVFIKDYNALVDLIGGLVSERPNTKYQPLTDDQKNEMSEKQVEKWESEAKKGILNNDTALRSILNELRTAMGSAAKAAGIRLVDMGITTGSYTDNGKLTIGDEAKFLEALKTNGDKIAELFTDKDKGIAVKLNKIIEGSIKKTGGKESLGRLITLAGVEKSSSEKENNITRMIAQSNRRIEDFRKRLVKEEQRLWSQFTAMETALSRMEAQSSMLMQFTFG